MDMMEAFHIFAMEAAEALNKKQTKPLEGYACSVMVVIAKNNVPEPFPMAGALNYDKKSGQWYVDAGIAEVKRARIADLPEQG